MADISIGNTTISNPLNLLHNITKLETYERTIDGSMIINRNVTSEDQSIDKYRWELPGIIDSEMFLIKEEAKKQGNLYLIDYHLIIEVLSGDGATTTFYTQREMSGATPVPVVSLGGVAKTVTVSDAINPSAGNVYAKDNVSGRARFIFGDVPPDTDNNIVIKYEPKYAVHILSYQHTFIFGTTASYTLICEEV